MIEQEMILTVAPTIEPVSLTELQAAIYGYNTDDNDLLTIYIQTARELFELYTGLAIIEQTWQLFLPAFPNHIRLPKQPHRSISSITYYDTAGAQQTLSTDVYRISPTGILTEKIGQYYPATEDSRVDAVTITYTAGIYASNGASPEAVDTSTASRMIEKYALAKQAIKYMAAHYYENRAIVSPVPLSECPMTFQAHVNLCRVDWA
jgi:uncharacterized phiE125 gp8 family phage protein